MFHFNVRYFLLIGPLFAADFTVNKFHPQGLKLKSVFGGRNRARLAGWEIA